MGLPSKPGWYPWSIGGRLRARALKEPRYVIQNGKGQLCVMEWREVEVPLEDIGGVWGKRITALDTSRAK